MLLMLLQDDHILDGIATHIQIQDIVNLTRLCRCTTNIYKRLFKTQWNVDNLLQRYVDDATRFRETLTSCRAIITGSLAHEYFERPKTWRAEDMDLMVPFGPGADELMAYFSDPIKGQGYTLIRQWDPVSVVHPDVRADFRYNPRNVYMIHTYIKETGDKPLQVQICVPDLMPPLHRLLVDTSASSSCNFLTGTAAYSIFPRQTFIKHQMLENHERNRFPRGVYFINKYRRRGYDISGHVPMSERYAKGFAFGRLRSLADECTWKIKLSDSTEIHQFETELEATRFFVHVMPPMIDDLGLPGFQYDYAKDNENMSYRATIER